MPNHSMGTSARYAVFSLLFGAAVTLCALLVAEVVSPTLAWASESQSELGFRDDSLMSCADADMGSSGQEPMWCADPSSPHCIPAVPSGPAPDLSDHSAPGALFVAAREGLYFVCLPWPEPTLATRKPQAHCQRLDRPPRV